jgi:hypothetical protein
VKSTLPWALAALLAGASLAASAEESQFAYVYTTDLLPQGAREIEQWLTWRHQKAHGRFDELEGKTEFEFGATDSLQLALYANYAWSRADRNGPLGDTTPPEQFADKRVDPNAPFIGSRFVGVSGEAIYRLLSPYTDLVGLALYVEPTVGPEFREVESKIILQRNFFDDRLTAAFNFTYAPEWRHAPVDSDPTRRAWQEETDINWNIAASYRFIANWSAGAELLNEHEYNSFRFAHESNDGYFVGPTVHFGGEDFFVTATFLEQLPWARLHGDSVPAAVQGGRVYDNDFEKYRIRVKAGFWF